MTPAAYTEPRTATGRPCGQVGRHYARTVLEGARFA